MNFTYKELKSKLEHITTLETCEPIKERSQLRQSKLALNDLLSKRHHLR
jgi:dihydroorotase